MMRNIEWIVLDDLKMNLIAALIVLIFAASFSKAVELPFNLSKVVGTAENHSGQVKSTKVLVFRDGKTLKVRIGDKSAGLKDSGKLLSSINPTLPVKIAVEDESELTYDQLLDILANLKGRGIRDVSLIAENR